MDLLGDSFDVIKQSMLRWLSAYGPWSAFPMFTHPVAEADVTVYSYLLGVQIISSEILDDNVDRGSYFAPARACETNLFLDPDTGVWMQGYHRKGSQAYLMDSELVDIAKARPARLTLVFDKSVGRGSEHQHIEAKLDTLVRAGLWTAAYVSHACFILVACDLRLMKLAVAGLRNESRLPSTRFMERYPL